MKKIVLICGFLIFASNSFAQNSNPDGFIGKPVFVLLGGFHTGSSELTLWQNMYPEIKRDGDFSGFGLLGEITFPASERLSLIFQISGNWQKTYYPETFEFFTQESRFAVYGFVFGFRIFTQ